MAFSEMVKERFSVRSFSDRPVEQEKLDRILEAAKHAPTAANRQPQRIYVLKSKEALEKANRVTKCMFGAPMALLVCYDETEAWRNPFAREVHSGEVDASIVCDEMMMQAWELGIGSCWVGYFDPAAVVREFDLPEHIKPVSMLPLGYAAENCVPLEKMHNHFRPMEEIVTVL